MSLRKVLVGGRKSIRRRGLGRRMFPVEVFDLDWLGAQRGKKVRLRALAEIEYEWILPRVLSPHPLLEPEFIFGPNIHRGGDSPLARYLSERGGDRVLSPVFSEATWTSTHPEAPDHPGRSLGHFVSLATDDTLLPVPAGFAHRVPTWGEFRRSAFACARSHAAQESLKVAVTTAYFDEKAGRKFVERWSERSLPSGSPLVTVVMPVYNRPSAVLLSIESVKRQTLDDWELIIIDDGSTDNTVSAVAAATADDPRIKLITRGHQGVCAARNSGIEAASGKYIAFLDSDNEWEPGFLRVMTAYLSTNQLRGAHCVIDSRRPGSLRYFAFEGTRDHLMIRNYIPLPALVAETSLVREAGGFDPTLRRWVDYDLVIRIAERVGLPLLPFIGMRLTLDSGDQERISVKESSNWEQAVRAKNLVDWDAARLSPRAAGRVSVLMPILQDWKLTLVACRAVLTNSSGVDVELVVIDNGSRRPVAAILQAEFATEPGVRIIRQSINRMFATASNIAFLLSSGETVVFLNNDTEVQPGWLPPLLAALEDPEVLGAQPLLTYGDGTVQAAGTIFPGSQGLPAHLLASHPVEDALKVLPRKFKAVTAAAVAMRAVDVAELRGFDPIYVNGFEDIDLCLRAQELRPGYFTVVPESRVTHFESRTPGRFAAIQDNRHFFLERWRGRLPESDWEVFAEAGFTVAWTDPGTAVRPSDSRIPKPVLTRGPAVVAGVRSLRWAIKISAHPGRRGDLWGDVFFADELAGALRRLGQDVVIDRRESFYRPTAYLDDVTLTLRGLDGFTEQAGALNLLWVISHPDQVDLAELARFDLAFAASNSWSQRMTEAGVVVRPLLQATSFRPTDWAPEFAGHEVLFVGSSRKTVRPIVRDAIEAGLPLSVFGQDWEGRIDPRFVFGNRIDNAQLASAYASAGVVLCDHWDDMGREGFLSNRLFDAVASGARVISDEIPGITETFGSSVAIYKSSADLKRLAGPDRSDTFPPLEELKANASRVARDHSFDGRARTLLDAVLQHRAGQ